MPHLAVAGQRLRDGRSGDVGGELAPRCQAHSATGELSNTGMRNPKRNRGVVNDPPIDRAEARHGAASSRSTSSRDAPAGVDQAIGGAAGIVHTDILAVFHIDACKFLYGSAALEVLTMECGTRFPRSSVGAVL